MLNVFNLLILLLLPFCLIASELSNEDWSVQPSDMIFTIDQGKKAIFSFSLFNNTKTILSIDKIYPGCAACTKILSVSNKELKPSQWSEILFSFQKRTHGKFNYIIWISEKNSLVEPLELELWMTVRKAYDISGGCASPLGWTTFIKRLV